VSQTSRSGRAVRNPPEIRGVLRLVEDDTAAGILSRNDAVETRAVQL
jgi:hypothetical protein